MRTDIFYWKCDSPISPEEKKRHFSDDKYTAEAYDAIRSAVADFLGHASDQLDVLKSDGDHRGKDCHLRRLSIEK